MSTDVANPLIAARQDTTGWYSGIGVAEGIADIRAGLESGSWIETTIGGVGTSLEALAFCVDPLGAAVSWGVAWLIEHVKPLSDALDWLAGDPDQITAYAQTWQNVSKHVGGQVKALFEAVRTELVEWSGPASDAYRRYSEKHLRGLTDLADSAGLIGTVVEGAGLLVALVRELVRDLIADFVSILAVRLWEWLAEAGLTLGIASPWVAAQVSSLVAKWVAKVAELLTALARSVSRLRPILSKLGDLLDTLQSTMKNLRRTPGGTATPDMPAAGSGPEGWTDTAGGGAGGQPAPWAWSGGPAQGPPPVLHGPAHGGPAHGPAAGPGPSGEPSGPGHGGPTAGPAPFGGPAHGGVPTQHTPTAEPVVDTPQEAFWPPDIGGPAGPSGWAPHPSPWSDPAPSHTGPSGLPDVATPDAPATPDGPDAPASPDGDPPDAPGTSDTHPSTPDGSDGGVRTFTDNADGAAYGRNTWGDAIDQLSPDQMHALKGYASDPGDSYGPSYREINGALRGDRPMTPELEDVIARMDEGLKLHPTPEPVMITRNVHPSAFDRPVNDLPGSTQTDPAFFSTQLGVKADFEKGGWNVLHLEVPAGTPAMYVDPFSRNPGERELLLGRGQRYVVDRVEKSPDGFRHIFGRIIGNS